MKSLLVFLFSSVIFFSDAQHHEVVDFIKIEAEIIPVLDSKEILGSVTYNFELKAKTDSIFIDAINMDFKEVRLNGDRIKYANSGKQLGFKAPKKLKGHELFIRYVAKPKQTVYFIGSNSHLGSQQIWTQGQGKYTSHWLPSFDDMEEKIELDLTILANEEYHVIANGKLKNTTTKEGVTEWKFDMLKPMSSYLAAFVIGDFNKNELTSSSGVPIQLYYEPKDSLKVEPTYRYTKEIFDFLETEIGVAYPWQNYKQVPVQDFLYAGMENTGATIFSNTYIIDSTAFVDKNYVNVNAHEMAHQWFGNLVTEKGSKHHWLHEGFATYYAYLAEQNLFGDDHFYWKLYETAKTLYNLSENGGGEALTNPNANSLTFYEKGAWALVMLREQIGDKAFKNGIQNYLKKHQFKNVTIHDFLAEIEQVSNQDMSSFRAKWLVSDDFPWKEVKEKLKKESESLALVFEIEEDLLKIAPTNVDYEVYWDKTNSSNFKQHLIKQYYKFLPIALLNKAFLTKNIKIRQALASSLYGPSKTNELSTEFAFSFETLLNDKSYTTIENALIKLWSIFPQKRAEYFSKTDNITGFPNKNIRLLWLTLALLTEDYKPYEKENYYLELNSYTSPENHFEVRQLAFEYLSQIKALNNESLINLIEASEHHVWQFKKASRNLLKELSKNNELKERLLSISNSLNKEQGSRLKKIITQ